MSHKLSGQLLYIGLISCHLTLKIPLMKAERVIQYSCALKSQNNRLKDAIKLCRAEGKLVSLCMTTSDSIHIQLVVINC